MTTGTNAPRRAGCARSRHPTPGIWACALAAPFTPHHHHHDHHHHHLRLPVHFFQRFQLCHARIIKLSFTRARRRRCHRRAQGQTKKVVLAQPRSTVSMMRVVCAAPQLPPCDAYSRANLPPLRDGVDTPHAVLGTQRTFRQAPRCTTQDGVSVRDQAGHAGHHAAADRAQRTLHTVCHRERHNLRVVYSHPLHAPQQLAVSVPPPRTK